MQNQSVVMETLGRLILEELQLIRRDMASEVKKLSDKLVNRLDEKLSERSVADFTAYGTEYSETHQVRDLINYHDSENTSFDDEEEFDANNHIQAHRVSVEDSVLPSTSDTSNQSEIHFNESVTENNFIQVKIETDADYNESSTDSSCETQTCIDAFAEEQLRSYSEHTPVIPDCTSNTNTMHLRNIRLKPLNHFQCEICDKYFDKKSKLKAHIVVHSNRKPYACGLCGRTFAYKPSLKAHMVTHSVQKPYRCAVCEKAFSNKYYLNKHLKIHNAEKRHKCNVCGFKTLEASTLKKHMLVHTGEKPWSCSLCSKPFAHKGNMKKHMQSCSSSQTINVSIPVL